MGSGLKIADKGRMITGVAGTEWASITYHSEITSGSDTEYTEVVLRHHGAAGVASFDLAGLEQYIADLKEVLTVAREVAVANGEKVPA